MTTALTFLILISPLVVAGLLLARNAHRSHLPRFGEPDAPRIQHDLDAIRTRFEEQPFWPASGVRGERR